MAFNKDKCLKFIAEEDDCTISLGPSLGPSGDKYWAFSKDGDNWEYDRITLAAGECAYVSGMAYPEGCSFTISKKAHIVSGNVMSLVDEGAGELTEITKSSGFYRLFYNCSKLTSIPENLLPATTLAEKCYDGMFNQCTGLTSIPNHLLPATTLANWCYQSMFRKCTSLTSIPNNLLPAMTLAKGCYYCMFQACSNLTSIPENFLPATILANSCYGYMFAVCTNLASLPNNLLPANDLKDSCYASMFSNCTNLASLPDNLLPATTLAEGCYSEMFSYCSSLMTIPENLLPAKNLIGSCYSSLFDSCSNLKEIHVPFTAWDPSGATYYWVNGVTETGDFYCPAELPEEYGENRIPYGWRVHKIISKQKGSITFVGAARTAIG